MEGKAECRASPVPGEGTGKASLPSNGLSFEDVL